MNATKILAQILFPNGITRHIRVRIQNELSENATLESVELIISDLKKHKLPNEYRELNIVVERNNKFGNNFVTMTYTDFHITDEDVINRIDKDRSNFNISCVSERSFPKPKSPPVFNMVVSINDVEIANIKTYNGQLTKKLLFINDKPTTNVYGFAKSQGKRFLKRFQVFLDEVA